MRNFACVARTSANSANIVNLQSFLLACGYFFLNLSLFVTGSLFVIVNHHRSTSWQLLHEGQITISLHLMTAQMLELSFRMVGHTSFRVTCSIVNKCHECIIAPPFLLSFRVQRWLKGVVLCILALKNVH